MTKPASRTEFLTVPMLERQGIKLNAKKLYRLYKEERLTVRRRASVS